MIIEISEKKNWQFNEFIASTCSLKGEMFVWKLYSVIAY